MFSASSFFAPTYQSSLINKHDQVFSHSPPFYRLPPLDASEPELRRRHRPSHLHQPRLLHQPVLTRELRRTSAVQQLQYVFLFFEYQICIRVSAFFRVLHSSSWFLHSSSAAVSFDPKVVRNSCGSCFASIFNTSRSLFL